jgi:hypothetical protein
MLPSPLVAKLGWLERQHRLYHCLKTLVYRQSTHFIAPWLNPGRDARWHYNGKWGKNSSKLVNVVDLIYRK